MVRSRLTSVAPELEWQVVLADAIPSDAEDIFREHRLLVVDGLDLADMQIIRRGLVKRHRAFKKPFQMDEPPSEVLAQLSLLRANLEDLFSKIYPNFSPTNIHGSFRPMVTGPEPIHFDTFDDSKATSVISFTNVAETPREYAIGPNLDRLFDLYPNEMRKIAAEGEVVHMSYRIRNRTTRDRAPLCSTTPRSYISLAPGAVWFFNSKTVSHEVIHGDGAYGLAWDIPGASGLKQADVVARRTQQETLN